MSTATYPATGSSPVLSTDSNGPLVNDRYVLSFQANNALAPGTVVKIVGSQVVDSASAATDNALGIVWNAAFAGRPVDVITRGVVVATSDNAVTAGDLLTAGFAGAFHDIGSTVTIASALPGQNVPFVRAIALGTQATVGATFLAAIF
jgi:hypothetical protein